MKVGAKVNFEGNYAVASDKLIKRCQCLQDMNFHLYQGRGGGVFGGAVVRGSTFYLCDHGFDSPCGLKVVFFKGQFYSDVEKS